MIKMLYFHRELKFDYQIQKAVDEKKYFKVDDGLYSDKLMIILIWNK